MTTMIRSTVAKLTKSRIVRKYIGRPFLSLNGWVWRCLPSSLTTFTPVRSYGKFLHALIKLRSGREFNFGTHFFRNRPQLDLIRRLVDQKPKGSRFRVLVIACSKGAEVYSIMWTIRSARPDVNLEMCAVDISKEIVEFAQRGVYSLTAWEFVQVPILERMTDDEMRMLLDKEGDQVRIQPWLRKGIVWRVGDASDPNLVNELGRHDLVVGNNFLCHMEPPEQERCLRNIGCLVEDRGHLVVSGLDLEVRTRVAQELGWKPLQDSIEEIHYGDPSLIRDWPWQYWGLEPLDKSRPDWKLRYASVFQIDREMRAGV